MEVLTAADAGFDIVAPSDMMDGRVAQIEKPWMKGIMKM